MSKKKISNLSVKKEVSMVRSSAAEYLTFIAASGKGGVEAIYADENIWLTQKMMGILYDVQTHTINYHLKKVFADSELPEDSVIRNFRITAADGKTYNTRHYNLAAIIAVGYPHEKLITLSKAVKKIVDDKAKYTDWSQRSDIKAELKVDLILVLDEHKYPPVPRDDVFKEIFEQAENFRKYRSE